MTKVSGEREMVKQLTNPMLGWAQPLGDVMRQAHHVLVSYLDGALDAAGYSDVRSAHVSVLATVHPDGSRLTALVDRGGRTKQATAQLSGHLLARGYLEIVPDPSDRRAKLYLPTPQGYTLLNACAGIVGRYEDWLESMVGAEAIARLRATLITIVEGAPAG